MHENGNPKNTKMEYPLKSRALKYIYVYVSFFCWAFNISIKEISYILDNNKNLLTCAVKPKNERPLCYCAYFSNGFVRSDAFWAV